jgi:glycosyltransferase involved in cell wall biosynthesis
MDEVTVVIPTRNRAQLLRRTMCSLANQQAVSVRLVVVDEASSDETPSLLASWDRCPLTVIRHDQPVQVANARNAGLAAVATPWVSFSDDDDLSAPDRFKALFDQLRHDRRQWATSGAVTFIDPTQVTFHQLAPTADDLFTRRLLGTNIIPGGGTGLLASTSLLREVGGFDPSMLLMEDWECAVRLAERALPSCVNRPLIGYRRHPTQQSHDVARLETSLDNYRVKHGVAIAQAGYQDVHFDRMIAQKRRDQGDRLAFTKLMWKQFAQNHRLIDGLQLARTAVVGPLRHRLQRPVVDAVQQRWLTEVGSWLPIGDSD